MSVLQLTRVLSARPDAKPIAGIVLRHFAGPEDVGVWLELRRRSFAREKLGIGNWQPADFEREFVQKPWWNPQYQWFAVAEPADVAVGTVTLALRGEGPDAKPVVHWLAVAPGYRQRGVGGLLMATLEAAVWDSGGRQVWLETHTHWAKAGRLYESLGYGPAKA